VCQDAFFFLMPDGTDRQVALMDLKGSLCFCQLDVRFPKFFIRPFGDIRAKQVTTPSLDTIARR
jgi:hypothetical protein